MSAESVRVWLAAHAPDLPVIEVEASTATVEIAVREPAVDRWDVAQRASAAPPLLVPARRQLTADPQRALPPAQHDVDLVGGGEHRRVPCRSRVLKSPQTLPQQAERARWSWHRGSGRTGRKPSRGVRRAAAASVVDGIIRPDELNVAISTQDDFR